MKPSGYPAAILLVLSFLAALFLFATLSIIKPYTKEGVSTQAQILKIYVEPNHQNKTYNIKRLVDYEYYANGKRHLVTAYNTLPDCRDGKGSKCRAQARKKSKWLDKKPGDTFDILYLRNSPNEHRILLEEKPEDFFIFSLLLVFSLTLIVKLLDGWYISQLEFLVSAAGILIIVVLFNIFLYYYYKSAGLSDSIKISEINVLFVGIALAILIYIFSIWRDSSSAVAKVTIQSIRRTRFIYKYILSYEFKDSKGYSHFGVFEPVVFFKPVNHEGKAFSVRYSKQKPSRHVRLSIPK